MIIVCPNCSARLQIDDDKAPSRAFSVRCPKCSNNVSSAVASPASEQSALAVGDSPSTAGHRFDPGRTAPAFELEPKAVTDSKKDEPDDAVKTLLKLLRQAASGISTDDSSSNPWLRRKALVCTSGQYREAVARRLAENNYQVFVAEETRQAIETMRSNPLQVVLLEGQFDAAEQGAAFVVREINVLRASHRRRLFFVLLSPSLRTMDAHAAFLNNVNAVVNLADVDQLPEILDIALRDFNELYKDFNGALSLAPL
jgi:predicted Zn finger-like uncharacterized protein